MAQERESEHKRIVVDTPSGRREEIHSEARQYPEKSSGVSGTARQLFRSPADPIGDVATDLLEVNLLQVRHPASPPPSCRSTRSLPPTENPRSF